MISKDFAMADLLLHTGQMVLLDRVTFVDGTRLTANLVVRGDGLLLGNAESVAAWTGIEYMAKLLVLMLASRLNRPVCRFDWVFCWVLAATTATLTTFLSAVR